MDILVTGANGLLGRQVVTMLQERGDAVRALVLPSEDAGWLEHRGVSVFRGDLRSRESLVEPMRGVDGLLNLAGMMGLWSSMQDYYDVNVTGVETIAREAMKAGVRRMVHISSWRVYGNAVGVPCREDMPFKPLSEPYSITKVQGEQVLQRLIKHEGLPVSIIRPGTFFGPGDRLHFGQLADRLRSRASLVIGSGENAVPFVYVSDVALGVVLALDNERAIGEAYNITTDEVMTQAELIQAVADEVGAQFPKLHVPYAVMYAAALAAERIAQLPGYPGHPLVTRMGVTVFGADNRHSIDKARRQLGFSPQVTLREGVRLSGEWYRQQRKDAAKPAVTVARA